MAAGTWDTAYGTTPWATLDQNEHTVFVPELLANYVKRSIFFGLVDYKVDLGAARTKKITFTQLIEPEPNIAELDVRAIQLPSLYVDSRSLDIETLRYGDKVMLLKYDDYITSWKKNGRAGLRAIMDSLLAPHMVQSLDRLARNAFIGGHFTSFSNDKTGFHALKASDDFEEGVARAINLGAAFSDFSENPVFCLTSPSATYQLKGQTLGTGEWISRHQYVDMPKLINYEIGSYEGVRFSESNTLTLWNVGEIVKQATIDASIIEGAGAPDPETTAVDGVWHVGQHGATHGVTYTDVTGVLAVGDYVTLHVTRAGANATLATQHGPVWNNAVNLERRVVSVGGGTICFNEPISSTDFQTDLGGGVYGYITLARPVHAAIFIKGPRGVVCGVTQPPQTYVPPAYDDTMSVHRFAWDAFLKYQQMFTDRFEVYFYTGPYVAPGYNKVVTL